MELVVPWPVLEFRERDREVVEVESPAAVVEVDRIRLAAVEKDVLVVEIAVEEAEGARRLHELPRRRPDDLESAGMFEEYARPGREGDGTSS